MAVNPKIAILGVGAVGGFLAGLLTQNQIETYCIVSNQRKKNIDEFGLKLSSPSFGTFTTFPKTVTQLDSPVDYLFICTKSTSLQSALTRVPSLLNPDTLIIPLLNGFEHLETIRKHFLNHICTAGTVGRVELSRTSENQIIHHTPTIEISLASDHQAIKENIDSLKIFLSHIGITVLHKKSETDVIWSKLIRLNALATVTSASRLTLGEILDNQFWKEKLRGCIKESAQIARANGYIKTPEEVWEEILSLPKTLKTSTQRDIEQKKPSELDSICGAVIRLGKTYSIECPVLTETFQIALNQPI